MKRILFLLGFGLSILALQAQDRPSPYVFDYLYLRDADSTVLAGWIMEQVPGEYVKIELPGGSIMIVEQSKIAKITRERSPYKSIYRRSNVGQIPYQYLNRGVMHGFDLQFALPQGEFGNTTLNPTMSYRIGYQWNRYLGLSAGAGIDFLQAGLVLPVFGELSGYLYDRPTTPYYSLRAGYGFGTTPLNWNVTDIEGGLLLQGMLGVIRHTRSRHQIIFGLGFKSQMVTVDRNGGWDWQTGEPLPGLTITRPYQGIMINIGLRL
ncbi:MAG: hypothetical protein AAFQ68_12955 [Bacteroidota bacterium]